MNKYQKQKSREIKDLMKQDPLRELTYKQARKGWGWMKRLNWCSPCEDCTAYCKGPYNKIAFCGRNR